MTSLSTSEAMQHCLQDRLKKHLSDQVVADFQRDGAVCIRQLLNADEVALLRDGIDANLAAPSPRAKVASRPDDPGRFFEDFCNWQDIPEFGRFVHETPLALAAQRLMQSRTVRLYHDHVLVNDCDSGVMRHADAGYELAVETAKKQGLKLPMVK